MVSSWYWWIGLLIITFISRWWPRILRPNALNDDTYYHLLQSEYIRELGMKVPRKHPKFILPGKYIYPPVYHFILAFFPKKAREKFETISSALFDTFLVAIFLWLSIQVLMPMGWSIQELFLLGFCFSLSPGLVGIGVGPRAYQGTARTLSELISGGVWILLWANWANNNWITMSGAILFGALLLNTSRFGGQMLLFFTWIMAFILNSTTLMIFPIACFIVAIVISKGDYWRTFKYHLSHLRLYAVKLVDIHPITIPRKSWIRPKSFGELARTLLYDNMGSILLSRFIVPLLALGLIIWNVSLNQLSNNFTFIVVWLVSAFVVFIITSRPKFLFLGEAERYLEYALLPGFIMFGALINTKYQFPLLIGLGLFHLILYGIFTILFVLKYGRDKESDFSELIAALNNHDPAIVLSLLGIAPWALAYSTQHKLFFTENLAMLGEDEWSRLFWRYPMPHPDFGMYIKDYDVELLPISKKAIENAQENGIKYSFDGMEKRFENDSYLLFRVPDGYINNRSI